jgi:hypothetical protein
MITMDICGRWRRSSPGRDIMWNMYKMYHICSLSSLRREVLTATCVTLPLRRSSAAPEIMVSVTSERLLAEPASSMVVAIHGYLIVPNRCSSRHHHAQQRPRRYLAHFFCQRVCNHRSNSFNEMLSTWLHGLQGALGRSQSTWIGPTSRGFCHFFGKRVVGRWPYRPMGLTFP